MAVTAVVLYHFSPRALPSGYLGVDVFMVVSGFIVTNLLLRERERTGRIRIGAFWGRRFRRLVPALVLLVIVVCAVVRWSGPPALASSARSQGLASLLYVTNWKLIGAGVSYGGVVGASSPFLHLWSLAVEEQFYLVWPLALVGIIAVCRNRRRLMISTTALAAFGSMAWMAYLFDPSRDPLRIYYGTDTRSQAFLVGAVGALAAPYLSATGRSVARVLSPAALLGVLVMMRTAAPGFLYRGGFGLVAVATPLVGIATTLPGALTSWLDRAPLRGLGRVSYGVYLWHWPAVTLLTPDRLALNGAPLFLARLAFTAVGTTASWVLVERPLTIARPRRVALTGGVGVGLAAASLIALPAAQAWAYSGMRTDRLPTPVVYASVRQAAPRPRPPASRTTPPGTAARARLTLPSTGTAMIVGDSGMYSATPAFAAALDAAGWRVVETAYPGVGLTSLNGRMQDEWTGLARQYHVDLTIVMLGSWDVAWEQQQGAGAYRSVVARSVAAFTSGGGKVLWLSILPGGGKDDRPLDRFYTELPSRYPGVVDYLDIESALRAPDGGWPRVVGGRVLRQLDGWHLCPDGAAAVTRAAIGHLGLARTSWDAGPWRTDGRYRPASEGCPA